MLNSISHVLRLRPQRMDVAEIVEQVASHNAEKANLDDLNRRYTIEPSAILQGQYEGRVLSLVIHELATVAPAAGESIVMELVADVWRQAEEHLAKAGRTGWAHISWFVQNTIPPFARQQLMAGC